MGYDIVMPTTSSLRVLMAMLALAFSVAAQVILATNNVASAGGSTHHHVVKGLQGVLWSLSVAEDTVGNRPLLLQFSTDQGQTWNSAAFTFNDAVTGLNPPNATNVCALAVDSQGTLHVVYGSYYYPNYFNVYYRNWNPITTVASTIVNLNAAFGIPVTARTDAMAITVDAADTVWIAAPTTLGWVSQLLRSQAPSAATLAFTSVGTISSSASSQGPDIVVDAAGRIHCSYYRNIGAGEYEHRYFDPSTSTWGTPTSIGNATPTNDFFGKLAADALGNVHALYVMDANGAATWLFRYKRWDAASGWSLEVPLMDLTPAQTTNIANWRIFSLACDEVSGRAFAVYRDLSAAGGGALRLASKGLTDTAFTNITDLAPPTLGLHEYYVPTIRGSLYPSTNLTGNDLDITWQYRPAPGTPPFWLLYAHASTIPGPSITLTAPAILGTSTSLTLSSPADPSRAFVCVLSGGTTPGIPIQGGFTIPLNWDFLVDFTLQPNNGVLTSNLSVFSPIGTATVGFYIPQIVGITGLTIYAGFVVDGAPAYTIGTFSPALAITLL